MLGLAHHGRCLVGHGGVRQQGIECLGRQLDERDSPSAVRAATFDSGRVKSKVLAPIGEPAVAERACEDVRIISTDRTRLVLELPPPAYSSAGECATMVVEINRFELNYEMDGDGEPLLWLHGFMCAGPVWTQHLQGAALRRRGSELWQGHAAGLVRDELSSPSNTKIDDRFPATTRPLPDAYERERSSPITRTMRFGCHLLARRCSQVSGRAPARPTRSSPVAALPASAVHEGRLRRQKDECPLGTGFSRRFVDRRHPSHPEARRSRFDPGRWARSWR